MTQGSPSANTLIRLVVIPVVVVTIAGAIPYAVPALRERALLATFVAAVTIASWAGGFAAGVITIALGVVTGRPVFPFEPSQSATLSDEILIAALVTIGLIVAAISRDRSLKAVAAERRRAEADAASAELRAVG